MYSILLVDDEKAIRDYLPIVIPFEEHGFKITAVARNGQEALDKLAMIRPDLILLDVRMPIMDGIEFLKILRQGKFSDTLVVVLSGYRDFDYAREAMRYGVRSYLNKPVDEDEIIPLLDEMRAKLDEYYMKKHSELLRQRLSVLNDLYNGAEEKRSELRDYTLMSCVLLPYSQECGCDRPYFTMQECISKMVGQLENCLFRSDDGYITLLLPDKAFEPFSNSKKLYADNLLGVFRAYKLNCSLLFDSYILAYPDKTFKEDFVAHMDMMLTELFFAPTGFIEYCPQYFKSTDQLCSENKYICDIRQCASLVNEDGLRNSINKLADDVYNSRLNISRIKEITSRIYYIIRDELLLDDDENVPALLLNLQEVMDCPYFVTFNQWRASLDAFINDALDFAKNKCKMPNYRVNKDVIDYVHQHYKEPITLKQIADRFFVNPVYLGRAFHKATGMNFSQYVNRLRIAEAKRLLLHTDKLIYEIASEIGYSESKYFITKFVEEVGKSPKEYRNQFGT